MTICQVLIHPAFPLGGTPEDSGAMAMLLDAGRWTLDAVSVRAL